MKKLMKGALASLMIMMAGTVSAETINLAMPGSEDPKRNGEYIFAKTFADYLGKNGMEVRIHPSNSLGKEKERFDQVSQGLIHINLADTSLMFKLAPLSKGFYLPFFFKDNAHFDAVLKEGSVLGQINKDLNSHGVRLAGFNLRGGQVGFFNTKMPVSNFSELGNLRMRSKDGLQAKLFGVWGAKSTVVSWSEVANALQTGVVDGYINPPAAAILVGHTDILKHFTPMNAAPAARAIMISEDWYVSLDEKQQKIVDEAVAMGVAANRKWLGAFTGGVMKLLKAKGVTVTDLEAGERDKFVAASQKVYGKIVDKDNLAILTKAAQ